MGEPDKNASEEFSVKRNGPSDKVIALAGNPNVGKSTVFNSLTRMNQHTGNWPGKTVANAQGTHKFNGRDYILVDLPGTYSLMAHSAEEELARDFILFGGADMTIVVCDATCLERNLNLVLQVMEITPNVVVCVNLMDEAEKKGIPVNLPLLEKELGVPVVGASARSGKGLSEMMEKAEALCGGAIKPLPRSVRYRKDIEEAVSKLAPELERRLDGKLAGRWLALRLLEGDVKLADGIKRYSGFDLTENAWIQNAVYSAQETLREKEITRERLKDNIVSCIVLAAEEVAVETGINRGCAAHLGYSGFTASGRDRRLDKILTSKRTGIPIMLALLCGIFWLTITGANYPSQILSGILFWIQDRLIDFFIRLGSPDWLYGALVFGAYRVLAWVVSVMLPPMGDYKKNHFCNLSITFLPMYRICKKKAILLCNLA